MYKIGVNIFDLIHTTFSSRKSLICLSFILFITGVSAQKVNKKWIISAGINAVDLYPTGINENNPYFPQGEILEDFFNISDHWNIEGQSISISRLIFRSFYLGVESLFRYFFPIIWIIHITQVISMFKKGSTQIKKLAPILDLVTEFQELTEVYLVVRA